ncbi:hypothetical protein FQR65_LT11243 [Abscondita terminalis]|nr:hypothetical protein FQR65_LT11243 [Abscondita terminalis]
MSIPKNLSELYSGTDLAILFKGNFINFGYWETVPSTISIPDVIEANKQLYHQVFKRLNPKKQDTVLELGSGHGGGCALFSNSYVVQSIIGMDYLKSHVDHSLKTHASLVEEKKVQFLQGAAESIPLLDESISKLYTVEAFQHFNASHAIPELKRILCQGGTLVISTFFAKDSFCFEKLLNLLPKPAILSDSCNGEFASLPNILHLLKNNSFINIKIENISQHVWQGYDTWLPKNKKYFTMPYKKDKKRIAEHRAFILRMQEREKRSPAKNVKIILMPMPNNLQNPPYPTLFHIRGTGFNASARYYSYITCSHIAEKSGCQVIDLDHHLAPEHPFPRPFSDVYDAYKFIIFHATFIQIDVSKIAISGYSSGGNLAALMTMQAKKEKLPVALLILISPILDLSRSLKKYVKFENKDNFPDSLVDWFIELYLQNKFHLHLTPEISPFWAHCLISLPPTYFLFGEHDRLRSDSEMFYDKLNQFGFWVHKSIFKKENHSVFWRNMAVIEVISTQLKMGFNLMEIPRPKFRTFLTNDCILKSNFFVENNNKFLALEEKRQHTLQR